MSYWSMVYKYDMDFDKDYVVALQNSLRNQLFVTLPATALFFSWYPIEYGNFVYSVASLPIIIVCGDIYFYLSHRPLHSKYLWHFHKSHHRGKVCVAKSLDADILEHFIGNLGSFVIGFLVLYYLNFIVNIYVVHFWGLIATINTCISHSAGHAPFDTGVHHIHHKSLKYNFGTGLYLIDRLMGSYKMEGK
ncbi:MAG: sterol desaturase family protein [Candidatus Hodarchaeales archaeon]